MAKEGHCLRNSHAVRCENPTCSATQVPLLRCGQCKQAQYCGRSCQRSDWKRHREECYLPGTFLAETRRITGAAFNPAKAAERVQKVLGASPSEGDAGAALRWLLRTRPPPDVVEGRMRAAVASCGDELRRHLMIDDRDVALHVVVGDDDKIGAAVVPRATAFTLLGDGQTGARAEWDRLEPRYHRERSALAVISRSALHGSHVVALPLP
jgi:hypothetical protein